MFFFSRSLNYHSLGEGGLHSTEVAFLLLTQQLRVQFPALPQKIQKKKLPMLSRLINGTG